MFGYSQGWVDNRSAMIVEVFTDAGITGVGEAFGPPEVAQTIIEQVYAPRLLGSDPFDIEVIWECLFNMVRRHGQKGPYIEALSSVDIALWDIIGKAMNLPVFKLLGGCFRSRVKAYATSLYLQRTDNQVKRLTEEAVRCAEKGFKAIKLKIGYGLETDLEYMKTVRRAIGDKLLLMVDANCAYNASEAIRLGSRMEDYNIYWFEEPVPLEDLEGYIEIKNTLKVPIAAGEREFTAFGFRDIISRRAVDIIQPDCCVTGGLSAARKIASLANLWNIPCVPHVWGTSVAMAASLQLCAVLPHCPASAFPADVLFEFDQSPNVFRNIANEPVEIREGYIEVGDRPGLGITLNDEIFHRYVTKSSETVL